MDKSNNTPVIGILCWESNGNPRGLTKTASLCGASTNLLVLLMPSAAAAKKAKKKVSPQTLAKKKLQAIRIVEMNFEKAALSDVLKKLADRSKEVDPEKIAILPVLAITPIPLHVEFT